MVNLGSVRIPQVQTSDNSLLIFGGLFFIIILVAAIIFVLSGSSDDKEDIAVESPTPEEEVEEVIEEEIDPCEGVDCGDNGQCINGNCDCSEGYTGENCETELEPCSIDDDCMGRASNVTGFKGNCDCECNEHFFGENCSEVEPLNFGEVNQDLVVVGEDGEKHCLSGTYEDSVNGTCTTCPSDGISTAIRSKAGKNSSVLDCRCSDIDGANNYFVNILTGSCEKCPVDTDNAGNIDEFSRVVPSINDLDNPVVGTVDDCKCSVNTGWHEKMVNGERTCVKCQSNSSWNIVEGKCICDEGFILQGDNVCQPDTRCLNKCGVFNVETNPQGEVFDANGLKKVTGLRAVDGFQIDGTGINSDILTNTSHYAETFKHTDQFKCQIENNDGKCYFVKDATSNKVACGSESSGWVSDCSKCKDGYKLTFNNRIGFDCVPDICGDGSNKSCFDPDEYENIIDQEDKDFINDPSRKICKSSDPSEPLSSNVCDITDINLNRNTGKKYRFTSNRFTNNGGTSKITCGLSENVRENGKCNHVMDWCSLKGHDKVCKNGSKCVNIDISPYYDCVDPELAESGDYNKTPTLDKPNRCPLDENEKEYLGYHCHLLNSDICLGGTMSDAGIKKLKNPDDQYGGIEHSDHTKPKFYDSSYPIESKRITRNIGNNKSDSINYQCVCDDPDKIGIYGVTFDEGAQGGGGTEEGLSPSTFCRCPRDGAVTSLKETPFHSIKASDRPEEEKKGLDGIQCFLDCGIEGNNPSMQDTKFEDGNYYSGKYFQIVSEGEDSIFECSSCNQKGYTQIKLTKADGQIKDRYKNIDFTGGNLKQKLCKPAYRGYYGTDTDEDGNLIGGESIFETGERKVNPNYIPGEVEYECESWRPSRIRKEDCGNFERFNEGLGNVGDRKVYYGVNNLTWQVSNQADSGVTNYVNLYTNYKKQCDALGYVLNGNDRMKLFPKLVKTPDSCNFGRCGNVSLTCFWGR